MAAAKLTPTQRKARKRLLEDFEFYAKHAIKIRTKSGEILPLVLNSVQQRFLSDCLDQLKTTGNIRMVILKGRQQGLSTVVSAFIYWYVSQHKGQRALVVAHVKDSTDTLFQMYKRAHENVPELLRPEKKASNKRELTFGALDSGIVVATAGGDGIARGETLQCMHLSEVAFWPKTFAKENFNGLIQALPNTPGTMCFVESTANGITGQFHELWEGAVAGTNGFRPFFSAWFESPEYREPPPDSFERTPHEEELADKYGLDDEQLYWRRRKVAAVGLDLFQQEYPCNADEAFITSGRPVFDIEWLVECKNNAPEPIARMAVIETKDGFRLVDDPRGELLVYHKRDDGSKDGLRTPESYVIGADVSVGIRNPEKSDYCVAQVLDSQKRQVAVWRGQVNPDYYAQVLKCLGEYYNMALVAPERNGHGLLVCVRLWKDLGYANVFFDIKEGEIADKDTLALGFQTNVGSRPLIIDKLRGDVRERCIHIYDQTTLSEMLSFIVTESGKMEAEQGCFDDCVLALAIANHIHEGTYTPVDLGDEFYAEAI
jgi:hypothetical protein